MLFDGNRCCGEFDGVRHRKSRPTSSFVLQSMMFEQARSFQGTLEELYVEKHPTADRTIHPDHRRDLQTLLSQYHEELLSLKEASGVAKTRELKFRKSIEPPPPSEDASGRDPTPTPAPAVEAPAALAANPNPAPLRLNRRTSVPRRAKK